MQTNSFTKILLGRIKKGVGTFADGENCYLTKHSWDCGWYWAFGYLGNHNCHFHFDSLFVIDSTAKLASEIFDNTNISDHEWWVLRDLFKQAYALKEAAAVYRYGGHQTTAEGITDVLKNPAKVSLLNADLARILDLAWDYACKAVQPKQAE